MFEDFTPGDDLPEPSWNIAPTQNISVLVNTVDGGRAEAARWSLTPPWSPTLTTPYPTFNARVEGLATKRTWSQPLALRRCAIVSTGFYEWGGPKHARTPYFLADGGAPLLMAGLYGWWRDPLATGTIDWHLTATILTRAATGPVASIHERAPVFIHPSHMATWMNPELRGTQALADAVAEASQEIADRLTLTRVRPLRGDGPQLTEPAPAPVSEADGIFNI